MNFVTSKFGFDISTWQDDPNIAGSVNFLKMRDNGASFCIMRASVGNFKDADFETYKINSRGILPRAIYHYYWNNVEPKAQAQTCLDAIGSEKFEGRIWLDLESKEPGLYGGWRSWKVFIETIQAAGLRVGIYTGYYYWQEYAVNKGADLVYFGQLPLWQAWYTSNPANVLVAQGWNRMMIWQDTSLYNGQNAGVESTTIDHNKWNDAYNFEAEWGTAPVITDGYQEIRWDNSVDVHIWRGRATKVLVTNNNGYLKKPSEYVSAGAKAIVNGSMFYRFDPYPIKPLSLAKSDGVWTQDKQLDPWYPFTSYRNDGTVVYSHTDSSNAKNLISGARYLVKDGKNNFATSTDPEHVTELHPRTATGRTADGKEIVVVVDGRSEISRGCTLKELADILILAGAIWAIEKDGGDSSYMGIDGVQVSRNGDWTQQPDGSWKREERKTVDAILYFVEESNMAYGTAKENGGRIGKIRKTASRWGEVLGELQPGVTINFTEIVPSIDTGAYASDEWFLRPDNTYVNYIISGQRYYDILTMPTTELPPTTGAPASIDMQLAAGSTVTVKDAAGNVLWNGTA
jgi:GH25 family lysozyme M1 (1,4-beta-N-acetylmuramidase)